MVVPRVGAEGDVDAMLTNLNRQIQPLRPRRLCSPLASRAMEAQLEICVHLEKFKNIDLYSQGCVLFDFVCAALARFFKSAPSFHRVAGPPHINPLAFILLRAGFTNFGSPHSLIQAAVHFDSNMVTRSLRANMRCPTMPLSAAAHNVCA